MKECSMASVKRDYFDPTAAVPNLKPLLLCAGDMDRAALLRAEVKVRR